MALQTAGRPVQVPYFGDDGPMFVDPARVGSSILGSIVSSLSGISPPSVRVDTLSPAQASLAGVMTLAMVSLAGIPPMAGFFGKFLLFKAVLEQAAVFSSYYALLGVAIVGVVISLYYYFGVIRTLYWGKQQMVPEDIHVSPLSRVTPWGIQIPIAIQRKARSNCLS